MAGHFNVFRRYQKASLAGLAIMAMLAFFVLPPLLMEGGAAVSPDDRVVVRWNGGTLRESDLERVVRVRRGLNQFLMALRAAATGDQRVQPPLRDDEKSVIELMLMAREAEANGIVVSDVVVNDFLGMWTGDMVTPAEMQSVIADLRSRAGVTESDLFDALRDVILGERLQALFLRGTGFANAPPGWRWDAFRKLEQAAIVEVVPVVVESLSGDVPAPSNAALEKLYVQYASVLPQARSTTPGFREPARARYDAIVAPADVFVAEAEAAVTDDEISKFYDENKGTMFKKVAEPPATPTDPKASEAPKPEASDADGEGPTAKEPSPSVDDPKPSESTKDDADAAEGDSAMVRRAVIRQVAFQKEEGEATPAQSENKSSEPASRTATEGEAATSSGSQAAKPAAVGEGESDEKRAEPKPAEGDASAVAAEFEPLEKVGDDIRKRLAQQAADKKIAEIFGAITAKIASYSDDVELAIGLKERVPPAPDVMKLAAEHGLQGVHSEFVTPSEAAASGGIGGSFQLAFSERFGVRQQRWADLVLSPEAPRFRPVTTRDVAGAQYLSWKTEDRPEFTPSFADIKSDVERVWKLLEARPLAKKRAQELAMAAKGKTLAEVVKDREGLAASTVGPFTWLTRGTAPFGSAPTLSDPEGIDMAGNSLMEAVFALQPGEATVAFNEPETICYAIRLVSFEPDVETLQRRFRDSATDPRRLAMLAEDEVRAVYERWLAEIERRNGVTWLRAPRQ